MSTRSETVVEYLGAGKSFAALMPDALPEILQSAFLARTGVICLIAFDAFRKAELQQLSDALKDAELCDIPSVTVFTPVELELMLASDSERFSHLNILHYIVFVGSTELRDLALSYWLNVYREMRTHTPVAYFCEDADVLAALHDLPAVACLSADITPSVRPEIYYFPDTGKTPELPESLCACLKKSHAVIHARLECARTRLDEAMHRAHALGANRRDIHVHIDPLEPVSGPIVATSALAMLAALTHRAPARITPADTCLAAYSLFSAIHSRALDTLEHTSLEHRLNAAYQQDKLIETTGVGVSLTAKGARLFPGIQTFAQLGALHSYAHDTRCAATSGDALGRIPSDFLRQQATFLIGRTVFHRHFHDILNSQAILKAVSCAPGECFLDALLWTCTRDQAERIRGLLQEDVEPSAELSPEAAERFACLRETFVALPHRPFLEVTPTAAHWWTFAGTDINLMLADIIRHTAPNLRISTGSLHLRLDWPQSPENTGQALTGKLTMLAQRLYADTQQMPNNLESSLYADFWHRHLYGWLKPLLPESDRREIFQNACRACLAHFQDAPSEVIETETLHEIDDLPFSFAPIPETVPAPARAVPARSPGLRAAPAVSMKAAPAVPCRPCAINSENTPTPVRDGIMHTQTRWEFINTPAPLSRAVNHLLAQPYIALDVETTLHSRQLCLIQIGSPDLTYIIDPLAVDFSPLAQVFENPKIIKIIHNASFEKSVLAQYNMQIHTITDTLQVSRRRYGMKCPGGHSLKAVCMREFGFDMDKTDQTSRWDIRPLSAHQLEYAALDAEILIRLYQHFFHL